MCDSESEQPPKKKTLYDTLSSHLVNISKTERQKRYREQNRQKLKQREAERRKRIQHSQSTAVPSTSSNTNIIEVSDEETISVISQSPPSHLSEQSLQKWSQNIIIEAGNHQGQLNTRHTINVK
ncbi:uncharacterized protein LOC126902861 [Daktulosphaira vitifoliae]|uniref:uncharacterized protein LOC126902861 n=1 Tax=Daktulosphaira vitifoliae TaxID=58002 RepID=UPI0021A9BD78|nr:uncharacterized protein LOC126902861 [Daktulosphaira vitifoliae]